MISRAAGPAAQQPHRAPGCRAARGRVVQRGQVAPAGAQDQAPRRCRAAAGAPLATGRIVQYKQQLSASQSRHSAIRTSTPGGICAARTLAVSSRLAGASRGSTDCCRACARAAARRTGRRGSSEPAGARRAPRRSSCRPGHAADRVNAHHHPAISHHAGQRPINCASSAWRPVKAAISCGSVGSPRPGRLPAPGPP
jgi:hypothetical protein